MKRAFDCATKWTESACVCICWHFLSSVLFFCHQMKRKFEFAWHYRPWLFWKIAYIDMHVFTIRFLFVFVCNCNDISSFLLANKETRNRRRWESNRNGQMHGGYAAQCVNANLDIHSLHCTYWKGANIVSETRFFFFTYLISGHSICIAML